MAESVFIGGMFVKYGRAWAAICRHLGLDAEAEEAATVTVRYGGEKYDPAAGDNALSYKVLKSSVEELTYGFDPSAETGNTVFVRIRE